MSRDNHARGALGGAASLILSRLEGVRGRASGQWSARCPAHADRAPSLSIRELQDGRVLVHCFSGCSIHSVLSALDLDMSDLFPEKTDFQSGVKRPRLITAGQALELLASEALLVSIVAFDIGLRRKPNLLDIDRVALAYGRIAAIRAEVNI